MVIAYNVEGTEVVSRSAVAISWHIPILSAPKVARDSEGMLSGVPQALLEVSPEVKLSSENEDLTQNFKFQIFRVLTNLYLTPEWQTSWSPSLSA